MDKSFLEPKDLDENIIALSEDMLSTTYDSVSDIERIKDKYGLTEQVQERLKRKRLKKSLHLRLVANYLSRKMKKKRLIKFQRD